MANQLKGETLAAGSRLVASAAHELKNPLEAISNLLYLLKKTPSLDSQQREYVSKLQKEVKRLEQITNETLHLYRESHAPEKVSVAQIVDTVLDFYQAKIAFKKITIEKRFQSAGTVEMFPVQIRQVFTNVVVNGLEAVPPGGRLRIHIARSREWGNSQLPGVRITILDNGPGIRREDKPKIFRSSFTTKGAKGSGLGLWLSRDIVRKHGGNIRFRSSTRAGHSGTCFSVFLPATMAAAPRQMPQAA